MGLRNNKLNPNHIDDATFKALTNLAGVSMPGAHLTPEEQKTKAIEDSLDWLRNNDPQIDSVDDPTIRSFSKLAGIPLPKKLTPENKKKTMDNAIEWLRNS